MNFNKKICMVVLCVLALGISSKLVYAEKESVPKTISSKETLSLLKKNEVILVDIRPKEECNITGKVKGAYNIPVDYQYGNLLDVMSKIKSVNKDNIDKVAVICRSGRRTGILIKRLREIGITNIQSVEDGTNGWLRDDLPTEYCPRL